MNRCFGAAVLSLGVLVSGLEAASLQRTDGLSESLARWRERHGPGWRIEVDTGTGYAEFLYGANVPSEVRPTSDAEWFSAARAALTQTQDIHGIDGRTLVEDYVRFLALGAVGSSDKICVRFRQQVRGVPVEYGSANVLFSAQGALLAVQTHALPQLAELDVRPAVDGESAAAAALRSFAAETRVTGSLQREPRLVIAQVENAESREGVLAWRVDVEHHDAENPQGFTYFIDARNGRVVLRESLIHHLDVGGTVYTNATPGILPDSPANPAALEPMRYARVTSAAGTTHTDANGVFNFPGVSGPLDVTVAYLGLFNDVRNAAGPNESQVFSAGTGGANTIVMNVAPSQHVTAQANVFQACNEVRDWVRGVDVNDATADMVFTANVNIANTCNTFYNGVSINFFHAAGGCKNSAYRSWIYHECGHFLNAAYGTNNGADGMGEGNADAISLYLADDPRLAPDFFCASGCTVRTGENARQFCGDINPGCHNGVHANGEVWMGAAWKVRTNLKSALGVGAGGALADSLLLGWMNAFDQTTIRAVIETQWLTLDDDDGDLNNGTPHFTEIDQGFRQQGFPGVSLYPMYFPSVTQHPDTSDLSGPYIIDAAVLHNFGASVSSVQLRYRTNPVSAYSSAPMASIGSNTYRASIPGTVSAAVVEYFVEALDSLGAQQTFPLNAPTERLSFDVGVLSPIFKDNFDTDKGWTVENLALTSGAWERGAPIPTFLDGLAAQPGSGYPLGSGGSCAFTGQGLPGGAAGAADVDDGPTRWISPTLNLSSGLVLIKYAWWLSNDDLDDTLIVECSNNNGATWVVAREYQQRFGAWRVESFQLSEVIAPSATVRIRFSIADNPNNSITEAAIDDFEVGVLITPCSPITTYCTAKLNSLACTPSITFEGGPSTSQPYPFVISASDVLNQRTSVLFYGSSPNAAPFKGGTLCVGAPVRRTPARSSGGSTGFSDCSGRPAIDFNERIQDGSDPALTAGAMVYAQWYYRDPAASFAIGLSNALSFVVCQ